MLLSKKVYIVLGVILMVCGHGHLPYYDISNPPIA
jgi:hypothetical protein